MKKTVFLMCSVLLFCDFLVAQVGISNPLPTAQLEISNEVTAPNFPLLELNPQATPVGSATGQLAVIGDQLYMYDQVRAKWLSLNMVPITFGRTGNLSTETIRTIGNIGSANTGVLLPINGTIVAVTANSNTGTTTITNNLSKEFQVRVRNGTSSSTTLDFNLTAGVFNDTTVDTNFNAGEHITVRVRDPDSSGDTINNPVFTIWVKWRQ